MSELVHAGCSKGFSVGGGQVTPHSLQGYTVCKSVIFALYLCTGEPEDKVSFLVPKDSDLL